MVQFLEDLKGIGAPPLSADEKAELEQLRSRNADLHRRLKAGPAAKKKEEKKRQESDDEDDHDSSDSEVSYQNSIDAISFQDY